MDLSGIKNIFFDLGNVILNIDPAKTAEAFEKHGVADFNKLYNLHNQVILFSLFETGKITEVEFCQSIRKEADIFISDMDVKSSWNAMLLNFPNERIELLKKLKENYNLYLISNTNYIHYKSYNSKFKKEYGYNLKELFNRAFLSHEMGMRKPDLRTFQRILSMTKLVPEETLFIDDLAENIEAGNQVGMRSVLLEEGKDLVDLFQEIK